MKIVRQLLWFAGSVAVGLLFIALWQPHCGSAPRIARLPAGAGSRLEGTPAGFRAGELTRQLLATVERMFYGWLLASLLGVVLGALIGTSRIARDIWASLEFIRPLPASAIAPIAIAFFGLSQTMVLVVIGFGTLWPMLLATVHGFAAVEPRLIEVARVLKLSRAEVIWKIALPNAMPDILAGMRFALSVALILAVVGEMLASQEGLGHLILLSARSFRSADLFAGVILLGGVGFVSNRLLALVERRLLRWRARS